MNPRGYNSSNKKLIQIYNLSYTVFDFKAVIYIKKICCARRSLSSGHIYFCTGVTKNYENTLIKF